MIWSIETITVARALTPGPEVFFQRDFESWVNIAVHMFVLRSDLGIVLVDSGLIADPEPLNAAMRRNKGQQAGFETVDSPAESYLGTDVLAVMLTSFGPYAAGGLDRLRPDTPVYVSARGLADLRRPEEPRFVHTLPGEISARLERATPVNGQECLLPGLRFHEVGIHHPASAAVEIETAAGRVVIADPVFTAANLERQIALGAAEDASGWFAMVRTFAARNAAFLPVHEPSPAPVSVVCEPDGGWHVQNLRTMEAP
ncbi:MAG: hypothetical protein P1V21_21290 [Rhizobiaceae bacterium]|nr:hypothetical protein [Rhizobiaceae bacterium]